MAITRRQFVTRLGALAAAVGMSQADISGLSEAFAANNHGWGGTNNKPKVIWLHGAECTGCSTSLLGILEDINGHPVYGDNVTTTAGAAVTYGGVTPAVNNGGPFSLWSSMSNNMVEGNSNMNIADVVIDVVDLQYHETVMGMGGDLAAQWLNEFIAYDPSGTVMGPNPGDKPFVLVVEGALQKASGAGAWGADSGSGSWCSIGATDAGVEIDLPDTVRALAIKPTCAAILAIGQCAAYGGYPGCKPPISSLVAKGFDPTKSQTDAKGVGKYLADLVAGGDTTVANSLATAKVVNVPGCPTNPWWFVMTVVLYMASYMDPTFPYPIVSNTAVAGTAVKAPLAAAVDTGGRLKAVYPVPIHSAYCPRYSEFTASNFALKPGDAGCLQKLGCKGIATKSSCGIHGWNNQQLQNASSNTGATMGKYGYYAGHCTKAGHPCMACTEKGYPDSFVPFVKL
jgi:Ni,Fe-hydrogenase I small subunit